MTEGDEPDSVFYIVSGTVKIFKGKKNRKQVGILKPGGSFGDFGVVNGKPRSASCVTDEPVEMLKIHAQNFKTIVDQALLHRLSEEHDSTTADFMALRGQPERARAHPPPREPLVAPRIRVSIQTAACPRAPKIPTRLR